MSEAIVSYTTESGVDITLSPATVRDYLVSGNGSVTDAEVMMFLQLCRAQRLNPFLREAYLIKFGGNPASIVTGKETFMKRAEHHREFDGMEAGVTVVAKDSSITRREGCLVGDTTEKLVGGWARIHRKDRNHPFFIEVALSEYTGRKSDGSVNAQWTRMPATMIRKVAIVQGLREAFPDAFGGLYSPEEIGTVEADELPAEPVDLPQTAVPHCEPLTDEETLSEIRELRQRLGIGSELYLTQLAWAQGGEIASDTALTAEAAEKLLITYRRLVAEKEVS